MYIGIGFYLCVIYMAYLKKTKRSKRKMRKTMRIRGGMLGMGQPSEPQEVKSAANAVSDTIPEAMPGAQNAGLATAPDQAAPDTKQQALAELEQAMAGLNKAVELLKQ
jgi:hypothetical protein